MDKGRVIQKGRHEDLLRQDGMYRRIYAIQTRIDEELEAEITKAEG
jgi:ATP-binding cassette subfamily B protein